MTDKALAYAMFAEQKAREISTSHRNWTSYLKTASRMYKYSYYDQLLIHAQRPDATACASYELWNKRMQRYIKRGSTGIGLLDIDQEHTRLHYVFDVSDTGARPGSVPVELWSMNADNETAVAIALADAYGVSDQLPLPDQLTIIVAGMIRDYWMEHREHLIGNIDGSKLMGYDEGAIGSAFRRAAAASTIYTILNRCGYEPDKLLSPDDFKDVQLFSTADTIAGVGSAVSVNSGLVLRQIERTVREYERSHEHDRTDLHPEGRLLLSESDGGRTEDTAAGQVRTDAPDIPEGTFPGAAEPARPERDAVSAPDGDRQDRPGEDRPDDAHPDGAERRDGGTEAPGSDEVGGADEQLSPADRGDDPERTGVQLSEEPAEDIPESSPVTEEPEAPPAPAAPTMEEALQAVVRIQPDSEQLNLFDFPMLTEAEQIASINQAESAPAPFAFPVAQSDIDHILRTGDNTRHHRQLIVSEFSKGKPPEQLVPLLKEVYHGGNGIVTEHGRISAWYGEDGIHLSKGSAARYVNTAHIVPWKDVASRIYELLAEGNFATNLEIAEAPSFERHNIADYLCYIARDLSDTGKEAGYLPTLRAVHSGGFRDEVEKIEELLADPDQYAVIADEVSSFYAAYEADRKLMRFRLPYITECAVAVEEYAMPRRDYDSQMIEVPAVGRFITDDEVDSVIEGGQGSYAGGALRIYQFFQEKHTDAERADFLKHTYGIGGRMPGVSGAFHSSEDHDTKGIKLKKADCEPVMLKWNKVAKRVEHMIQHGRYLSPEQRAEMEAIRDAHDEPEDVTEEPLLQEEAAPGKEPIAVPVENDVDIPLLAEPADRSADYRLLDRLRTDCEYFLGAGQRRERDLWAGNVYAHIEKMREIYALLPDKPEWLTETQIDSYADRMAPPYLVVAYHHFEGGFDAKMDYQTIDAAEKAAQGYIDGTMEIDGFHYDGAAIYDQSEKRYLRVYGDFPDARAMEQAAAAVQPVQESLSPAADVPTPVTETPYRVGDILYLDDLPFEVESIGKFDVHLRDPNAAYPIMRAESRERLAYLLTLDKRNAAFLLSDKDELDERVIDGESSLTEADAVLNAEDDVPHADEVVHQIGGNEPEPSITVETVPEKEIIPENYRINDEHLGEGGPKAKFRANVEAIRVLKGLEAAGRPASSAEQEILARYVGWGGLADAFDESKPAWASECAELKNLLTRSEYEAARASTLNAHYTSPTIIRAIYETIDRMGFTTGNILEPAMGVGNFFGMLPESMSASHLYGVELDSITGRIAQKLYPQADITVAGFETTDRRDFFDLAIGNVPFGNYQVHDPAYNKLGFSIHDYFFAKTLDQVRPGGVIAFVTSRYTMDKQSPEVRRYIAQRAEFLGAVRLPNNAFKANAGTDVVSDIIFLQKRDRAIEIDPDWVHLGSNPDGFAINSYFVDHPEMILGRQSSESTQYGKQDFTVDPIEGANLAVQLASAMQNMTEMYTMQRYLQYETLQRNNMTHFDCWASTFGESVTAIELAPEGTGYRARTRFSRFYNLPELMVMFREVADIKTADQLHLPTPTAHYETIAVKPSELQQEMVQSLSERAAKIHSGSVDPSIDNMLKITSDGRKLGLDQRLINPMLPDDPGSKVNACVNNVFRIWESGHDERLTQLIFCDISTPKSAAGAESAEFSVYDDIRTKLIGMGIPAEQIAFIHDANSEAKKKELFSKVNVGDVRILMGSTAKMGAGTNVQRRLVATHDLDCPWRPGDLEQRAGRIVRQGNQNQDVYVYRYVTEGTFDGYLWQTIEHKQKFISQIMTSKSPVRSCEDVDETALSYAEIKALCAGDGRIKEKMDLDIDVARLRIMKADHQSKQYQLEDRLLRYFPAEIALAEQRIKGFQADLDTLAAHPVPEKDFVGIEVLGHHYTDRLEAGNALIAACKEAGKSGKLMAGHYRGLEMMLMYDPFDQKFKLTLQGGMHHAVELGNDPRGNLQRMENALAMIPLRMATQRDQLNNIHAQIKAAEEEKGRPFPQEEELRTKSARLAQLDAELNIDKPRTAPEEERIAKSARPSLREQLKAPRFRSASKKPPETEAR